MNVDFLLDGLKLNKDNVLFCIETPISSKYRQELKNRGYQTINMNDCKGLLVYPAWKMILSRYHFKHYVVCNNFQRKHRIRNQLMEKAGIMTWYFMHSTNYWDLYYPDRDYSCNVFSNLYYDNFVCWGGTDKWVRRQPQQIKNYVHLGCLWSELIKKAESKIKEEANG